MVQLSPSAKKARIVPAKVGKSRAARWDAVIKATNRVRAKTSIDFVRAVRT